MTRRRPTRAPLGHPWSEETIALVQLALEEDGRASGRKEALDLMARMRPGLARVLRSAATHGLPSPEDQCPAA
jgi:hypothetical protein